VGPIEIAIRDFCNTQLNVYHADKDRIIRDTRAAERVAQDHVGRWFFELFQNSDDAFAEEVFVLIASDAIYVADTGKGLVPTAVKAICGTDFTDKTTGTIGRKGVGFKAVYEISENPQVFALGGEGIEFSQERTREWLIENRFEESPVPYQWIPFFISRDEAERDDTILRELSRYQTVVKLPLTWLDGLEKAKQRLEWPTHALLAFRYVRKLEIDPQIAGPSTLPC